MCLNEAAGEALQFKAGIVEPRARRRRSGLDGEHRFEPSEPNFNLGAAPCRQRADEGTRQHPRVAGAIPQLAPLDEPHRKEQKAARAN